MDLESELGRLFQAPLEAFVARRNELAQRLRAAGLPDQASGVRRLPRPAPAAWAVNQLVYRSPGLLERLREAAGRVRAAQESSGEAGAIMEASRERAEARRQAEHTACVYLAETTGRQPAATVQRQIVALLDAYAASTLEDAPGRLHRGVDAVGFDAFEDVAAPRHVPASSEVARDPPHPEPRRARTQRGDEQRVALAALVEQAAKRARELEANHRRAKARLDRATRDAAEAERRLEETRAELHAARADADAAVAALEGAQRVLAEARSALGPRRP